MKIADLLNFSRKFQKIIRKIPHLCISYYMDVGLKLDSIRIES